MSDPTPPSEPVQARPIHRARVQAVIPPPVPSPLELPTVPRRVALLDVGLVMLVGLVVPFGFQLVAVFWMSDASLDAAAIPLLTIQKWFDGLLVAGLLAYLLMRQRLSPACFGLRLDRPLRQFLWMLGNLAATYAWVLATAVALLTLMFMFPEMEEDVMQRTEVVKRMPVNSYGWTILLLIPVAVHEEILFRGLLLPYLRRVTGSWPLAIAISSGMFAVLHVDQGVMGALQILGVGTVLAVFFVLSRSLIAVIVAHFVFNFLQFQFMRLLS